MSEPLGPFELRAERLAQLESLYTAGLIAEFTQNPGINGVSLTWTIDTHDQPEPITITSREVPVFTRGILAGASASRHPHRRPTREERIPFTQIPDLYGITMDTFRTWLHYGTFPRDILSGVVTKGGRHSYADAYLPRSAALHWGRSAGRLLRDGTPNTTNTQKSPAARAA